MENQNQNKLYYLKNHQYNLENFKEILQEKEFNIYEFVSVFNPLINTILTSILLYTDNLRIIAISIGRLAEKDTDFSNTGCLNSRWEA